MNDIRSFSEFHKDLVTHVWYITRKILIVPVFVALYTTALSYSRHIVIMFSTFDSQISVPYSVALPSV